MYRLRGFLSYKISSERLLVITLSNRCGQPDHIESQRVSRGCHACTCVLRDESKHGASREASRRAVCAALPRMQ